MHRRDLLKLAALAACLPHGVRGAPAQAPTPSSPRSLVLVELKGGNDGLNTLVPYSDPEYPRLRPKLAIAADQILRLDDRVGLHPALRPFTPAWDAGELAWIQGVGYAQPNRSHFRSMDIWDTASDSDEVLEGGWIARHLPPRSTVDLPDVLVLGGGDGPARGGALQIVSLQTPEQFAKDAQRLKPTDQPPQTTPALEHLLSVRASTRRTGAEFQASIAQLTAMPAVFPKTPLGGQLQQVARMLIAGMQIPVFKVQIGSFDTHANQLGRHQSLLTQLAEALAAFRRALSQTGNWDQVLVMSYSEFGRRAAENASAGTDHGAAAPHFVLGGQVKGGLYGEPPDLTELARGDVRFTTDYRQLYATVAQRWWGIDDADWRARFPAMAWL